MCRWVIRHSVVSDPVLVSCNYYYFSSIPVCFLFLLTVSTVCPKWHFSKHS
uniref:Uncharacterized protein n=1 Tax=Anguilla anguilla TaxID=7936 RepID=A0A0E9UXI8_ANGAN